MNTNSTLSQELYYQDSSSNIKKNVLYFKTYIIGTFRECKKWYIRIMTL